MSKRKLLSIAVIGLLLLNLGLIGFLFLRKPMRPPGAGGLPLGQEGPKQIIIEKLAFNPEQAARYEELIKEHQEKVKVLDQEIKATKNALYQTLTEETPTEKDSLINRMATLQKEIETVHYNHFAAIRKICTPEQMENYKELTSELARFFSPRENPPPPPKDL
jgi:Spy/CpxP family protein refolding chaperone